MTPNLSTYTDLPQQEKITTYLEKAVPVTAENRGKLLTNLPPLFRIGCNFLLRLQYGTLIMALPDGRVLKFCGHQETEEVGIIEVKDYAFARRSVLGGDIGFFESYLKGEWDTPDLAACLYIFPRNAEFIQDAFEGFPLLGWYDAIRHRLNKNTKTGSRKNIMAHYDLGNQFYAKWLDPTMTYSSALFRRDGADLHDAQTYKYESLAAKIDLKADETVLEIGSGWGGFAEYAAKTRGARVTAITLSREQLEYARERIFKAGLAERVTFELRDYRDVNGQFDKIASIEMFEAVGKEYWPTYFSKVHEALAPGGVAGFQVITIADRFATVYERSTDFIQRYVFPGGMLPTPNQLREQIRSANLDWKSELDFGTDYADTLREWRHRFLAAWDEIRPLGFDDQFKKLWKFYLAYCEAGFRAGTTNVHQFAVVKAR